MKHLLFMMFLLGASFMGFSQACDVSVPPTIVDLDYTVDTGYVQVHAVVKGPNHDCDVQMYIYSLGDSAGNLLQVETPLKEMSFTPIKKKHVTLPVTFRVSAIFPDGGVSTSASATYP